MKRLFRTATLAALVALTVGCGDGGRMADQQPLGPEVPARFTGVDADGDRVGALPEGNPIRTPENYHPVDELTGNPGGGQRGCHDWCDGDQACIIGCDAVCSQSSACARCLCDDPENEACDALCDF